MESFYSHSQLGPDGTIEGSKTMSQHIQGLRNTVSGKLPPVLNFSYSVDDLEKWIDLLIGFHDLGKYTGFFQTYLLGNLPPSDQPFKQHSRFGAFALFQYILDQSGTPEKAYFSYFMILCHHRNLFWPRENPDNLQDKWMLRSEQREIANIFEVQREQIIPNLGIINQEMRIELSEAHLSPPFEIRKSFTRKLFPKEGNIEHYFLVNYLFSLLIEADKLDASNTPIHVPFRLPAGAVDDFLERLNPPQNPYTEVRQRVRREVVGHLANPHILSKRLFVLTAPTGIGKTLTALDFAIGLREKIYDEEGYTAKIITALPFINIIEQTLDVYQSVFESTDATILAHYQYADVMADDQTLRSTDSRLTYQQKVMQLDTWQADIVITSFVQLLQTLISNKNKTLKKFHHLAGAIIIMDEVQSLRLEQVPFIGTMLYMAAQYLGCRFVLMTATQPLIFELADEHILSLEANQASAQPEVFNLIEDPKPLFREFSRTQIITHFHEEVDSNSPLLELMTSEWDTSQSCLIVLNTVQRSLDIHRDIQALKDKLEIQNPVFYLSTNVVPAVRKDRISEIKQAIESGKAPILISTQVIEAGVDLDFDMGIRDLGPIDSIVQVAGRINRENAPERALSPLHIVDLGDCAKIYGPNTRLHARKALSDSPIPEPEYFELTQMYFKAISDDTYADSRGLYDAVKRLEYDGDSKHSVGAFRVIEESNRYDQVFIELPQASNALRAFQDLYGEDRPQSSISKHEFDRSFKKIFQQHLLTIPKYLTEDLPLISEKVLSIRLIDRQSLSERYACDTGFIRNSDKTKHTHIL
ncbi:CRISPR-associated helicase Cas3' [Pontibacter sp. G13]|uniref:CRISPR-associated helicase Cas3' n=1 Tax=Pontibacter sp. G13 TaxID=3074898 RepID=UPI00288BD4CE|nr:CRISPR-associated helicase Cas3' [Pontibacter sp. G13]WNJ18155.1 CRISPR-associated helicase Cas3' [Pontibacter sp. G13]